MISKYYTHQITSDQSESHEILRGGLTQQGLGGGGLIATPHPPPQKNPQFLAPQGDANVRTNAQIKFLYDPLISGDMSEK